MLGNIVVMSVLSFYLENTGNYIFQEERLWKFYIIWYLKAIQLKYATI